MIFRSNSKKECKTSNERWIEEKKLFENTVTSVFTDLTLSYPSCFNQINARKRREETVFRHFVNDD